MKQCYVDGFLKILNEDDTKPEDLQGKFQVQQILKNAEVDKKLDDLGKGIVQLMLK